MIARVSHIRLVGLVSERNKLMDKLTENGLFEARETDAVSYALRRGDSALYRELKLKQSRVVRARIFKGTACRNVRRLGRQRARGKDG